MQPGGGREGQGSGPLVGECIKHKTRYAVKIDTEALLADVVPEIEKAEVSLPPRDHHQGPDGCRASRGCRWLAEPPSLGAARIRARATRLRNLAIGMNVPA